MKIICKFALKMQVLCKKITRFKMETTIYLDTRSQKKSGRYPLKLRLQFKGKQIYFATGIDIVSENFKNGTVVGNDKRYQSVVFSKKLRYDTMLLDLERCNRMREFDHQQLKSYLENNGIDVLAQSCGLFFKPYLLNFIEKYSNKSTKNTFLDMQKKVASFCNIEELTFENINVAWLKDFDIFMEKGKIKTNTRGIYMRNIRTMYNDAIDRELLPLNLYPFRRFKIKQAQTRHRDMPIDDIKKLINYDTSEMPAMQRYIDFFLLSFYLCGLNMKDILFLTKNDISNGYITINRSKTNVPMSFKIQPEAQSIIDRHKGKNYLLSPMDNYTNYIDFERKINKHIKKILPYISVYWARHTWATVAAELDVPDTIIDLALGHKISGMKEVYINRNRKKIDAANRKVIDYLFGKIKAPEY